VLRGLFMFSVPSVNRLACLATLSAVLVLGCDADHNAAGEVGVTSAALLSAANCPPGYNIIQGTSSANTLTGTAGNDCILGHGGNDILHGMGGNDFLVGGAGADTLNGNDGDDTLYGEDNGDTLNGNAGNDTLYGGLGADNIFGGDGNDIAYGEAGNDIIEGGIGDDRLYGSTGQDIIRGGDGLDRIFGEGDADDLYGDGGDDIIDGAAGADDVWGGTGHDVIQGGANGDNLRGDDGNDAILGGSGANTINGGNGSDRCAGTSCELSAPTATGCTQDSQCNAPQTCVVELGVCLPCLADADGDNSCDGADGCPTDPGKSTPGICGCGVADTDSDGDGTANCNDACSSDPSKTAPGICGCGVADADSDSDGTADCNDACPNDTAKVEPGVCGCGVADSDSDGDGTPNCNDACSSDPSKTAPGICGCGVADTDSDSDGTADCNDACPNDAAKVEPGLCGCGVVEADSDSDGVCDASDVCPGSDDAIDSDDDGIPDGCDGCFSDAECEDGNECTVATCVDRVCSYPAVPRSSGVTSVANGSFSFARFDDFTQYQTPQGTMVSSFTFAGMLSSNGPLSQVAALRVGRASGVTTGSEGGGLRQVVNLNDGDLTVSVNVATLATITAPSSSDGGTYTLFVDGIAVSTQAIGTILRNRTQRRLLIGTVPSITRGAHEIRVEATRAASWTIDVLSLIDNIVISGLATRQPAECADGAGVCVDAGTCEPCVDSDADGTCNDLDGCASDPGKAAAGACGCWAVDTDGDADGTADCIDLCPNDPNKVEPLTCGCGISDIDTDQDLSADCNDGCPNDPSRTWDDDTDSDGTLDCRDECTTDPNKIAAGVCGCGFIETDPEGDGNIACVYDACTYDPNKTEPGICGCDVPDVDSDSDGVLDCNDVCEGSDDALDEDEDGVPDGCDIGCVAGASGPFIHEGDVLIASTADIEALEDITCITGNLAIMSTNLQDLSGLEALEEVAGQIAISHNDALTSLAGLNNLTSASSLYIVENNALVHVDALAALTALSATLHIADNESLSSLSGLANLEPRLPGAPGALLVAGNAQLPPCWAWLMSGLLETHCGYDINYNTECYGNLGVGSCGELPPDFVCAPGARGPGVYDGDAQIHGGDFQNELASLNGVQCITGSLTIQDTDLTHLDDLASLRAIAGSLFVSNNRYLTDIALPALTTIGGGLSISENDQLTSLAGLSSLESLSAGDPYYALFISYNPELLPCWAWSIAGQTGTQCSEWWQCDGNRGSGSCGELPPDFVCEPGAVGPNVYNGDVDISGAQALSTLENLDGVQCITGTLSIGYATTDLDALAALRAVGGSFVVQQTQLTELALPALTTVGGVVRIENNDALVSLAGLSSLTSVNGGEPYGSLVIGNNPDLPPCWMWLIEGQTGVDCGYQWYEQACFGNSGAGSCGELPQDFACEPGATGPGVYRGDASLGSGASGEQMLANLDGVQCITGSLEIRYYYGTDLDQLAGLRGIGGNLVVQFTEQLSDVELPALTAIGGAVNIRENDALTSLAGLAALQSIGAQGEDALFVGYNPNLAPCWVWLIEGQTGVECGEPGEQFPNYTCLDNLGSGSCGELPIDFVCERGATGPGVYHGDVILFDSYAPYVIQSFSGARCITGDLKILSTYLSDLDALASLEAVGDDLWLITNSQLTDVELPALSSVGGALFIESNPALTSLSGLGSLEVIGSGRPADGLAINGNALLPECWVDAIEVQTATTCGRMFDVPDWASCENNNGPGSCAGAAAPIDCGPETTGPGVYQGNVYASGAGAGAALAAFEGIECITGSLVIADSDLNDLSQLAALTAIGGDLEISSNALLASIDDLAQLRQIGGELLIDDNAALPACWVHEVEARTDVDCGYDLAGQWQACGGNEGAGTCQQPLPTYCQPGATGPGIFDGSVQIWNEDANVTAEDLEGIHCITGSVTIVGSSLANMDMFQSVAAIGGSVTLMYNAQLTEVDGLSELESIAYGVYIEDNPMLSDLAGLTRLRWVGSANPGSGLAISYNPALPECWRATLWVQLWSMLPWGGSSQTCD
jgi:hypothetical protein